MKVRLGFVTNSSSSSFVCIGLTKEQLALSLDDKKRIAAIYAHTDKYIKESVEDIMAMTEEQFDEWCEGNDAMYEGLMSDTITVGGPCNYSEDTYIGVTMSTFFRKFPDAKFSDARRIAAEELNKHFNRSYTEKDVHYIEEGYYS